jgi:hypothetical protein
MEVAQSLAGTFAASTARVGRRRDLLGAPQDDVITPAARPGSRRIDGWVARIDPRS